MRKRILNKVLFFALLIVGVAVFSYISYWVMGWHYLARRSAVMTLDIESMMRIDHLVRLVHSFLISAALCFVHIKNVIKTRPLNQIGIDVSKLVAVVLILISTFLFPVFWVDTLFSMLPENLDRVFRQSNFYQVLFFAMWFCFFHAFKPKPKVAAESNSETPSE